MCTSVLLCLNFLSTQLFSLAWSATDTIATEEQVWQLTPNILACEQLDQTWQYQNWNHAQICKIDYNLCMYQVTLKSLMDHYSLLSDPLHYNA